MTSTGEQVFQRLQDTVRHVRTNFVRDIRSEVIALSDARIIVLSRLLDEHHDISLALEVDQNLIIQSIGTRMERIPYPVCAQTLDAYDSLAGLFVFKRGIVREIRTRVQRNDGCTHITELLEASLRALFAGLYNVRREVDLAEFLDLEEIRQLNIERPFLKDTCLAFSGGDVDDKILASAQNKIRKAGHDAGALDPMRSAT